jgi:hypothetical protein
MSARLEREYRITVKTKNGGNQSTHISIPSLRIIYTPARSLRLSTVVHETAKTYMNMLEKNPYILLTNIQPYQRQSPLTPARGRGFDCGLKVESSYRFELAAGQVLRATPC